MASSNSTPITGIEATLKVAPAPIPLTPRPIIDATTLEHHILHERLAGDLRRHLTGASLELVELVDLLAQAFGNRCPLAMLGIDGQQGTHHGVHLVKQHARSFVALAAAQRLSGTALDLGRLGEQAL